VENESKPVVLSGWRVPVAIGLCVLAVASGVAMAVAPASSAWIIAGLVGLCVAVVALLVVGLTAL